MTVLFLAATESSFAGSNAGGTLVVAPIALVSTCGYDDPCVRNDECFRYPNSCEEVVPSNESGGVRFGVYAAFPGSSSPSLLGVAFGIQYDPAYAIIADGGPCGAEDADFGWPSSGTGTVVTFASPQTEQFVFVRWFFGYAYGGTALSLTPHPSRGGVFFADTDQEVQDPIASFGRFGFAGNQGYAPCPDEIGACCLASTCFLATETECIGSGGEFRGVGSLCDETECGPTPVSRSSWGEIKRRFSR